MKALFAFLRTYPTRSAILLLSFLVAGLAEGLSLSVLLPLISIADGNTPDPGISTYIIDTLNALNIGHSFVVLLSIVVGGIFIRSILLLIANQQIGYSVAKIATSLRLELIDALLASKWQFYLRQPTGALANSIATEAYRAAVGFQNGSRFIALIVQVAVYTCVAMFISWKATIISLFFGAIFLALLHHLVRSAGHAGTGQTVLLKSLLSYLTDVLGSVKSLKAMSRDKVANEILRAQTNELESAVRREVINTEALRALQEPMLAILAAVGLYFSVEVLNLTLSSVMVLAFLLARILGLLNSAQREFLHLKTKESAYWALLTAAQQARKAAESSSGKKIPTLQADICIKDLNFSYGTKIIFNDLNLKIPVGAFIVLIGASGEGKSTLLDLLCGLVEPQSGDILIDGVPLKEIDLHAWRRMIGYVSQDTILLHDSILNNILIGQSDLTELDAENAMKQAGIWDFVNNLPKGHLTVVGERGGLLSGGQRQRVAIARALAHDPQILVLDEPTSSLDQNSERVICETLRKLSKNHTIIAASHQRLLIETADYVFEIKEGKAVPHKNDPHNFSQTRAVASNANVLR